MSKEEREKALAEITKSGAEIGKSLRLDNGYVIINGDKYECADIKYNTTEVDGLGIVS